MIEKLMHAFKWFMTEQGRMLAPLLLFAAMTLVKKLGPLKSSKRRKLLMAGVMAAMPAAAIAWASDGDFMITISTLVTTFLGAMGIQSGQKAIKHKAASDDAPVSEEAAEEADGDDESESEEEEATSDA